MFAVDWDRDAAATYKQNFPDAEVAERDIQDLETREVGEVLESADSIRLFAGCAPCQPFANHQHRPVDRDSRTFLLLEFLRFITDLQPELVFIENVPGMQRMSTSQGPFARFQKELSKKYEVDYDIVSSADYGVPQMRRRLVLLASRLGKINIPPPTHGPDTLQPYSTVRQWIGSMPRIEAGREHPTISHHKAGRLSDLNIERINATPEGGDRRNWPPELLPDCHRGDFKGHTDVYGRMSWDKLAPTLTTKCISYSNGRFGHPEQNRAISVREAACLQTFPESFRFTGPATSQARQIGNAVPVILAKRFGQHIVEHVNSHLHTAGAR